MTLEFFNIVPLATMMYVGIASAIVTVIGAGVSYVGAQQQADQAEAAGKAQQEAAANSARNQELQAAESIRRERINNRRRLARLRSEMNSGGVTMADSSMDVFAETAGRTELSIQDAARSFNMDAQNTRSQGDLAAWEARALARATRVQSYGTLLSGASSAATKYASTR